MKKVLNSILYKFEYSPKNAQIVSKHISKEIQYHLKFQFYERLD